MAEPVPSAENLLRHIHPNQWDATNDRAMSGVFKDREMSVDRELLRSLGEASRRKPAHGFARFTAQVAITLGQEVLATPIGEATLPLDGLGEAATEENPAHAEVVGAKPRPIRIQLRDAAFVALRPEGFR